MFNLTLLTLLLPGTAYAACAEGPDDALCAAVEFAKTEANASFGSEVISSSAPYHRRPSTLYAKLKAIRDVSEGASCEAVSTWAGSYNVPSGNGVTSLGDTVTASVKGDRVAGTFGSGSFGDVYSKVKGGGIVMVSVGDSGVAAGYYMRVMGRKGVWAGLQVRCPDSGPSGDLVYQGWLGGLPNYNVLTCGNGVLDAGEECDDNNLLNDDGCSATCIYEFCVPEPDPDPVCQCIYEAVECNVEQLTVKEQVCMAADCKSECEDRVQEEVFDCLQENIDFTLIEALEVCGALPAYELCDNPNDASSHSECWASKETECGCSGNSDATCQCIYEAGECDVEESTVEEQVCMATDCISECRARILTQEVLSCFEEFPDETLEEVLELCGILSAYQLCDDPNDASSHSECWASKKTECGCPDC